MYAIIKRLGDVIISLIVLVVLSPIIFFIALVLSLQLKKSPFFLQSRPGKNEKIFKVIKFQTMLDTMDENRELLPDHLRITPFGKFLRKASLDELPQLINVLIGEMSFVGPRPLLVEYLNHYNSEQRKRHIVKPGITGWAQVNGRNSISWEEKFTLDVFYVENRSLILDMRVLFKTVLKVLRANGIQSSEMVTMEKFNGK